MDQSNKYHLVLSFVGSRYQGWQRQAADKENEATSVQEQLETACTKLFKKFSLMGSGRTDAGVHARRLHVHLIGDNQLSEEILLKALNAHLPNDIRIISLKRTSSEFHAQRSAKTKTYRYFVVNNLKPGGHINWPFLRGYTWFVSQPLDLESMRACLKQIEGEHDFKSFQNSGTPVKSTVRILSEAKIICHQSPSTADFPWELPHELNLQLLEFRFTGNGFLKQMVRNLVGTLVEAGQAKISPEDFKEILAARDRRKSGVTAPARGLFLDQVFY